MSRDIDRLVDLVRRDIAQAGPIIDTGRLDDLAGWATEWRRRGLPASSMGGGSVSAGTHTDPTGEDAIAHDPGNEFHDRLTAALKQITDGCETLLRLNSEAPASSSQKCARKGCNTTLTVDARNGVCGSCRKRDRRQAA